MTHTYIVDGITCNGCVAKVKGKLLMHPDVTAADVTLEGQKAIVSMQRHVSLNDLQEAIGKDTKYTIREDAADHSHNAKNYNEATSWFASYKPLIIIGVFITGVSWIASDGNVHLGMNYFMAGFFLVFSFFKILDVKGFALSYSMYDLLAIKVPAYGYIYPFIELGLGLAFLTGFNPFFTNIATIVVMGFSSLGVIKSVIDKQQIRCACLGAVFNLPMSTVTIIEDLLMVAMAAIMLFQL